MKRIGVPCRTRRPVVSNMALPASADPFAFTVWAWGPRVSSPGRPRGDEKRNSAPVQAGGPGRRQISGRRLARDRRGAAIGAKRRPARWSALDRRRARSSQEVPPGMAGKAPPSSVRTGYALAGRCALRCIREHDTKGDGTAWECGGPCPSLVSFFAPRCRGRRAIAQQTF